MKSNLFKILAWGAATSTVLLFVVAGRCWVADQREPLRLFLGS